MTQTISATTFQRRFGKFKQRARSEPLEITRHRRRRWVLMSAEHYDGLVRAAGRALPAAKKAEAPMEAATS